LSVSTLDNKRTAKRRETMANGRLLDFIAQIPSGRKKRRVERRRTPN
jgi:hypothetical protein